VRSDLRVQWQLFTAVAGFIALFAIIYWFVSYEDAGTTMLGLASGLALLCGGWLYLQDRRSTHPSVEHADAHADAEYLPTASVWPLAVGVGAALTTNGLILGWPYAAPGAALLALALVGFVGQSRRRG
jgi:hypothetical protein